MLKIELASDIGFGKNPDKMENDFQIFEKQQAQYTEWFKSEPRKRVGQRGIQVLVRVPSGRKLHTVNSMDGQEFCLGELKRMVKANAELHYVISFLNLAYP